MDRPTIIVTRPARDAARWVARLQAAGVPAEALPLIDIVHAADPAELAAAWHDIASCTALMFVSANAVEAFFAGASASGVQLAVAAQAGVRFMAPGPGTVAALLAAGVPAAAVDAPPADAAQFDSEALWAVVGDRDWQGARVLIVRGGSRLAAAGADVAGESAEAPSPGRDWLAARLRAAGARVDFMPVYARQLPDFTADAQARAEVASRDGSVWLFSSSEAVGNLTRLVQADWSRARAIATHPRIAEASRAAGWGLVHESRPDLEDIKARWASIESAHDE
ncbi:MAG: uroporphyrinogen-III synthase [Polaromonas sp.]|nr:uroporphyrinogen-III synthase [Polaromonas sp.]